MKLTKHLIKALLLIFSIAIISGCGGKEAPVEITKYKEINQIFKIPVERLEVVAMADSVEIRDVVVNRGNCKITERVANSFPANLTYGGKINVFVMADCPGVREVDITTNAGSWSFSF